MANKYYYHPDLKGRYSIKVVLPHLVPEMANDYKILYLIQNGGDAMNIYPKLKQMGPEDIRCYRKAFLAYCELDTLAVVKVLEKLRKLA